MKVVGHIKKIMQKSIKISLIISFFVTIIFYFLAEGISIYFLKDERCILSIKILVLALPFISVSSCIKGYFIAKRNVSINSFSQLLEQLVRIILIFVLLEIFGQKELEKVCMFVIFSDIISEIFACAFLYFNYKKETKNTNTKNYTGFKIKDFFQISLPITINKNVTSILRTIENILIPNKLTAFTLSREVALSEFGYLKGMALPLVFFPASFLSALSTLLVPETSEANTLSNKNKISNMVLITFNFTLSSAILISTIFFSYSKEISCIFYSNLDVSFYIKYLAPLIPFMYLESAIVGIMQGLNEQKKALKYSLIDSLIRISLICIILPYKGIKGFLFVMYVSNIVTSFLNATRVLKISNTKINLKTCIIKPFLSAVASLSLCKIISIYIIIENSILDLLLKICIISFTYICILFLFGIIKKDDLKTIKIK